MSYESEIENIADALAKAVKALRHAREDRERYTDPKSSHALYVGGTAHYLFDTATREPLEPTNEIRLAYIKAIDGLIFRLTARIEGYRWKLVQLGKVAS